MKWISLIPISVLLTACGYTNTELVEYKEVTPVVSKSYNGCCPTYVKVARCCHRTVAPRCCPRTWVAAPRCCGYYSTPRCCGYYNTARCCGNGFYNSGFFGGAFDLSAANIEYY